MIAFIGSSLGLVCIMLVTRYGKWISCNCLFIYLFFCISHCIGYVKFTGEMTKNYHRKLSQADCFYSGCSLIGIECLFTKWVRVLINWAGYSQQ